MPAALELSGQIWPLHHKPLEDELLSSWLARLARAYGVPPVRFWSQVWPSAIGIRWAFVDHAPPAGLLRLLAEKTATPLDRVKEAALEPLRDVQFVPYASLELFYCPACLAADIQPYFRRRWQMSAFSFCERHACWLTGRCAQCWHPLAPHLVSIETDSIAYCFDCGADLRSTKIALDRDTSCERAWQTRLWSMVRITEIARGARR
jgi:hypothetical protein